MVEGDNLALSASNTEESLLLLLQHNLPINTCLYRTPLTTVPWFHSRRRSVRLSSRIRLTNQSTTFPSCPCAVRSYFTAANERKFCLPWRWWDDDQWRGGHTCQRWKHARGTDLPPPSTLLDPYPPIKSINTVTRMYCLATVTSRTLKILFPIPSEAEYGRTIPSDRIRRGALQSIDIPSTVLPMYRTWVDRCSYRLQLHASHFGEWKMRDRLHQRRDESPLQPDPYPVPE